MELRHVLLKFSIAVDDEQEILWHLYNRLTICQLELSEQISSPRFPFITGFGHSIRSIFCYSHSTNSWKSHQRVSKRDFIDFCVINLWIFNHSALAQFPQILSCTINEKFVLQMVSAHALNFKLDTFTLVRIVWTLLIIISANFPPRFNYLALVSSF